MKLDINKLNLEELDKRDLEIINGGDEFMKAFGYWIGYIGHAINDFVTRPSYYERIWQKFDH